MNEICCQLGPQQRLAGIVSEPDWGAGLGCVLVSAGLSPKVGPFRLYAELARRLTQEGIITLRFDLGGIGDSAPERGARSLAERTASEIGAGLDYLSERYAPEGLALAGLCSGAEDALRAAAADARVTSLVLIDPFAYRAPGFGWRHTRHRIARRALRALGVYQPLPKSAEPRAVSYEYMKPGESRPILRSLLARGVNIHFVYTGGMRESFNHPAQLAAQLGDGAPRGLVTLDYFPHLDHTQPLAADRGKLVEAIARRLRGDSRSSRWR